MLKIGVLLAVAVCAAAATAGTARASVPPLAAGTDWCGYAEGTCDTSMIYVECSDGTVWALDQSWDVGSFGEAICGGEYAVLSPPAFTTQSQDSEGDQTGEGDFSLSTNMAPDPTQYATEVQCPNGEIWAVASGDDFVCPAA
jgi:hypothetical protein